MFCLYIAIFIFLYYTWKKLSVGITRSATCLVGKTALITGANRGLGFETALNLASRGCRIIMADVSNMEESKRRIIQQTNNPNIVTKHLDLSSLKSVRDFASDIVKTEESLEILINNAGVVQPRENQTEDGLNSIMQINYFGHFLLTHLLIGLLKKSAPSRIVFVSSLASFFHDLTPENLNSQIKSNSFFEYKSSYSNSKFAILMASDLFAEKLKGSGVTSNSLHPGVVYTGIVSDCQVYNNYKILRPIYLLLFIPKDAWEGSQVLVHLAVSQELDQVSGEHFWDCKKFWKPKAAYDSKFREKIWKLSEEIVQLRPEEKI